MMTLSSQTLSSDWLVSGGGEMKEKAATSRPGDLASAIEKMGRALTVGELATLLGVHKKTLYKHTKAGVIPCIRINYIVRYDSYAIAAWLRERTSPDLFSGRR
jgi:excisionase family DNA binding protein